MGTGLAALYKAPATTQAPYGCLIEHTAPLIELTALSVGPFPLTLRRGTAGLPFGTPALTHRGQSRVRRERGVGGGRVRRGSRSKRSVNVSTSVGKPRLEM